LNIPGPKLSNRTLVSVFEEVEFGVDLLLPGMRRGTPKNDDQNTFLTFGTAFFDV
jgi:hypothetical protein